MTEERLNPLDELRTLGGGEPHDHSITFKMPRGMHEQLSYFAEESGAGMSATARFCLDLGLTALIEEHQRESE